MAARNAVPSRPYSPDGSVLNLRARSSMVSIAGLRPASCPLFDLFGKLLRFYSVNTLADQGEAWERSGEVAGIVSFN